MGKESRHNEEERHPPAVDKDFEKPDSVRRIFVSRPKPFQSGHIRQSGM
tara:strand:- start:3451 stop:3597 length:147 start_codon:yes stop_codon:yes gene_type:complete